MAHVITRNRPAKGCTVEVPVRKDGSVWEWAMRFSGDTKWCWSDSVEELVAVLTGEPDYLAMDEQDRLVVRIKCAIRTQIALQAQINVTAQQNGDWDHALTEAERQVLNGSRVEQPTGWSQDLFGADHWTARVPLVLVSTGYGYNCRPHPLGKTIFWIDPITDEDFLETLAEVHAIGVFHAGEWEPQ